MFFSTLLVFHSYLELFISHDQWIRLIFDTVNDMSGFEVKTQQDHDFFHATM